MRAVFLQVCQRLTVVSYCMPGSPQCQVGFGDLVQQIAGAVVFRPGCPSIDVAWSTSRLSSAAACMKSSVTRTE